MVYGKCGDSDGAAAADAGSGARGGGGGGGGCGRGALAGRLFCLMFIFLMMCIM